MTFWDFADKHSFVVLLLGLAAMSTLGWVGTLWALAWEGKR